MADNDVVWTPSRERVAGTALARFATERGFAPTDYDALWRWSIEDLGGFWESMAEFCGLRWHRPPDEMVRNPSMPGARWFPGAQLSFAAQLLRGPDTATAVITIDEDGNRRDVTRGALRDLVLRVRTSLAVRGVGHGDRIAALMPNRLETVVALLAADSLGATFSSCSPDFGPGGVVDRFGQISPKVLLVADGYRYQGTTWSLGDKVRAVVAGLRDLELLVEVPVIRAPLEVAGPDVVGWEAVCHEEPAADLPPRPADDPLAILYSSGTTGPPKSIVHGVAGTLVKHLCEHRLHADVQPGDVVFWFTTCGWMMWNWLVSALASGATIVLYDGSPTQPDLRRLWQLVEETGITHFGTSPRFLGANAKAGIVPGREADLTGVKAVLSTGSPLAPYQFDWVYEHVADDVQLASVSGGTDLIGCFAGGVPTLPVRRGELQARSLGMAVEAWVDGRPVVGRKGELVCTKPFPSMPLGFWGDADGSRYRDAYYREHPGVWTHGDFIEIRPSGGVVIHGRSDTTLNPGGVRIGTAELYRAVEPMEEITDAIAVARPVEDDVEIVMFVLPAPGIELDAGLERRIRDRISTETSPRHVPRHIRAVSKIPYTISGKKVERAVLAALTGDEIGNRDALADPHALDEYEAVELP